MVEEIKTTTKKTIEDKNNETSSSGAEKSSSTKSSSTTTTTTEKTTSTTTKTTTTMTTTTMTPTNTSTTTTTEAAPLEKEVEPIVNHEETEVEPHHDQIQPVSDHEETIEHTKTVEANHSEENVTKNSTPKDHTLTEAKNKIGIPIDAEGGNVSGIFMASESQKSISEKINKGHYNNTRQIQSARMLSSFNKIFFAITLGLILALWVMIAFFVRKHKTKVSNEIPLIRRPKIDKKRDDIIRNILLNIGINPQNLMMLERMIGSDRR